MRTPLGLWGVAALVAGCTGPIMDAEPGGDAWETAGEGEAVEGEEGGDGEGQEAIPGEGEARVVVLRTTTPPESRRSRFLEE